MEEQILYKDIIEYLTEELKHKPFNTNDTSYTKWVKNNENLKLLCKTFPVTEKEAFIDKLCDEKEAFVNEIFATAYKEQKLYPYSENDYSVMALNISEDLTLVRVDFPNRGIVTPLCYRVYITFDPITKTAGYYTIEKTEEKDVRLLGGFGEDGKHISYGNAPVEGAELNEIINLARKPEGLTS